MSGPINLIPPGVLGFLQLKNFGKNPTEFPEVLAPTFDLLKWYLSGESRQMAATDTSLAMATNVGGFQRLTTAPIIVPATEWWYVHSVFLRAQLPAAVTEFFSGAPCWFNPNTFNPNELLCEPGAIIQGVAATDRTYFTVARDFWVPPGSEFGAFVLTCQSATTIFVSLNGRITVLPI